MYSKALVAVDVHFFHGNSPRQSYLDSCVAFYPDLSSQLEGVLLDRARMSGNEVTGGIAQTLHFNGFTLNAGYVRLFLVGTKCSQ